MRKIISIFLSLLTVFSASTLTVFADETYKETVTIDYSDYQTFSPKKEICVNGEKYTFVGYRIIENHNDTFEIIQEDLINKDYSAPKSVVNPNNSSQNGKLINTVFKENKETARKKTLSKTVKFKSKELDYAVPETVETSYIDEKAENVITAKVNLTQTVKSEPYWINSTNLKGSVTGYDALYYNLKNSSVQIPKNNSQPIYEGYENEILKSLGVNADNYKIIGSSWYGDTYYNSEGTLCRDCIYDVQFKVCDITATYTSEIELPDIITYTATSTYEDEKSGKLTIETEYEKANSEKNTTKIIIGTVTGVFILSLFIAAILLYLSKKKKLKEITHGSKI